MGMRYRFDEVKAALLKHWGFAIARGAVADAKRDGRWDVSHSRTGYIVSGHCPGHGHGHRRHDTLAQIVKAYELAAVIATARQRPERAPRPGDVTGETITDDQIREYRAHLLTLRQTAYRSTRLRDCDGALSRDPRGRRPCRESIAASWNELRATTPT